MNRSHGIRAALCVVPLLALAGCVENSYNEKLARGEIQATQATQATQAPGPAPAATPAVVAPSAVQPAAASRSGPAGRAPAMAHQGPAQAEGYALEGFRVYADGERLWVFKAGSPHLASYLSKGEPAKRVTLIAEGPHGKTLLGSDDEVMRAYALVAKNAVDGFSVFARDGRLWVFRTGSKHLAEYLTKGEPAKRVTLIGEGPDGATLMGSDTAAMQAYADALRFAVPGFVVLGAEGRLWVFKRGSADYASFVAKGEPAKRVTLIAAGPDGKTLMGADKEVLEDFAASHAHAAPGYVVIGDGGRLWVFRQGSDDLHLFVRKGEPAKRVTLIGSGPGGKTLLGSDKDAMEAYTRAAAN